MKKIPILNLLILLCFNFSFSQEIPYNQSPDWESTPLSHIATGLALADINGDGWKDMVVANGNDILLQSLVVYYNNGDGTFPLTPSWSSDDLDYHGHCAVGDINKNGWPDVAVSVYIGEAGFSAPGRVKVYYNEGGQLESTPSFESVAFYTFSCALGDANGNGWLDLAVATSESYTGQWDKGKIFYNNNGTFSATPEWESANLAGFMDVEFGDLNSNGFLDVAFIGNQYPNAIYLSDNQGAIGNTPAWQSSESVTYNNSVDIGYFGEDGFPGFVTTGNNQLGGDGKVRFYDFPDGVPANTSASWISPPVGYGSGVFLADVTRDGNLDLIYGGWWLPMRIIRGTGTSFQNTVAFTSGTSSVVEAIQLADLDREAVYTTMETITGRPDQSNAIRLQRQIVENILDITKNGAALQPEEYCFVPNKNWITFTEKLIPTDEITVVYEVSDDPDIVITNWDSQKGNYIFYNTNIPTGAQFTEAVSGSINIHPNPAGDYVSIILEDNPQRPFTVKITDLTGTVLIHQETTGSAMEVQLNRLTAGLYFVQVETGEKLIGAKKLMVQ
jgi:hypothetical protein